MAISAPLSRLLPAALSVALIAAPAAAAVPAKPARPAAAQPARPAASDWSRRITATLEGGILIGNPDAAVKLVEFGSLTCPHCRHFHETGLPALKARYLAAGTVSYEYRPFSLNGIDLMAGHLLYCQTPEAAWAFVNKAYQRQDQLVAPFMQISEADRAAVGKLPEDQQGPRMAELGGLPEFAGLRPELYRACTTSAGAMETLLDIRSDAVKTHGLTGTPSFLINGRMQASVFDWPALEPLLAAAVKSAPVKSAPAKAAPARPTAPRRMK